MPSGVCHALEKYYRQMLASGEDTSVLKVSKTIRRFEVELAKTLSSLERVFVRLAVFALFVVGLYVVTMALMYR